MAGRLESGRRQTFTNEASQIQPQKIQSKKVHCKEYHAIDRIQTTQSKVGGQLPFVSATFR
jgi:hypothetical protein